MTNNLVRQRHRSKKGAERMSASDTSRLAPSLSELDIFLRDDVGE
ncbi:hypothetical protein [Burkholderia ubonensis]|nr:hypothetical protein [Burkholderia ubonensis]